MNNVESKEVSLSYDILGEFDNKLATDFLCWCLDIEQLNDEILAKTDDIESLPPLTININSDGGSVQSLFNMLSAISILPNVIIVRGFGMVASSALFFYLFVGDVRLATPFTEFLYHNISYAIDQTNLETHRRFLKESDKLQTKLDKMVIEKSKITSKQLKAKKNEDWIIDYQNAIELGIVNYTGSFRSLYEEGNENE